MNLFSFKLKQKILSVIVLVVGVVMVVSSLVVPYVIYKQNVDTTNANIEIAANNIRSKLFEIQSDLLKKMEQMNGVFKVSGNVNFIAEFKEKYDLGMTGLSFLDLANGLFATSSANGIDEMAIYDATGELIAFSEERPDGSWLVGYYYINPKKEFSYTVLNEGDDLKKGRWETAEKVSDLASAVERKGISQKGITKSIQKMKNDLALNITIPIMVDEYNTKTEFMEPKLFGFVTLSKALDKSFVSQMVELTGMDINIFVGDKLSTGALEAYKTFSGVGVAKKINSAWDLKKQDTVLAKISVGKQDYLQGTLPIFSNGQFIGAFAALNSTQTMIDNTLQVVYVLVIVLFMLHRTHHSICASCIRQDR